MMSHASLSAKFVTMKRQVTLGQVRLHKVRLGYTRLGQVTQGQVQVTQGQVRLHQDRLVYIMLSWVTLGKVMLLQVLLVYVMLPYLRQPSVTLHQAVVQSGEYQGAFGPPKSKLLFARQKGKASQVRLGKVWLGYLRLHQVWLGWVNVAFLFERTMQWKKLNFLGMSAVFAL